MLNDNGIETQLAAVSDITLQYAYDNAVKIVTGLGAVQFQCGTASDDDIVLQILNKASAEVMSINGNGVLTTTSIQMNGRISGLADPVDPTDALNLRTGDSRYIQAAVAITLQQAYNSSISVQTTTTDILGAVQYQCGSASNIDSVLEVLNKSKDYYHVNQWKWVT